MEKVLSNSRIVPALAEIKLRSGDQPKSSLSESKIEGFCYSALANINGDELSVDLTH
jgi:hypothetical protein